MYFTIKSKVVGTEVDLFTMAGTLGRVLALRVSWRGLWVAAVATLAVCNLLADYTKGDDSLVMLKGRQ